jgi:hypothetical protein
MRLAGIAMTLHAQSGEAGVRALDDRTSEYLEQIESGAKSSSIADGDRLGGQRIGGLGQVVTWAIGTPAPRGPRVLVHKE